MRKDFKLFALLVVGVCIYSWLRFTPKDDWKNQLNNPITINIDQDGSNYLKFIIDSLLHEGNVTRAEKLIDSALNWNSKNYLLRDLKGLVLLYKGKPREGIPYFTESMKIDGFPFPLALGHRATAYTQLNLLDSALVDLSNAASMNTDYYKELAITYEKNKQKDSAVKYYEAYLKKYPDSSSIRTRLTKLQKAS